MIARLSILVVALGLLSNGARTPSEQLSLPPSWQEAVIYYQSFERTDGRPDINRADLSQSESPVSSAEGVRGRCAVVRTPFHLSGAALSPQHPLTLSFWWALRTDADKDTGFGLCNLQGSGYVSLFARSGPWCGLDRTAGVLQVYNLSGIQNVNGIYDRDLLGHLELKAGEWHHTALVFAGASLVTAYTDGRQVFQVRLTGGTFSAADGLQSLDIGGVKPLLFDEIVILNRPLSGDEIAEYVRALKQMRVAGYPDHY